MRERLWPSSVFAPVDRRALLRFAASCFSEIIVTYLVACCRLFSTMRGKKMSVRMLRKWARDQRWDIAGIGDAGISYLFLLVVTGDGGVRHYGDLVHLGSAALAGTGANSSSRLLLI